MTVGDHVEEVLIISGTQPLAVVARWVRHAALDDHAVAVARAVVTGRAEDVELLAAAREQLRRQRRPLGRLLRAREIAARHRARHRLLQDAAVAKQGSRLVLVVFWLCVHELIAAAERDAQRQDEAGALHAPTSSTEHGASALRKRSVALASKRASAALMQRKKRSFEAR